MLSDLYTSGNANSVSRLVCSDLISRGIDLDHVSHVVSYDAPVDMRKYVHRVGRTARAGREGNAWTLVEEQEVASLPKLKDQRLIVDFRKQARYFKKMLQEADHLNKVKRLRVSEKEIAPLTPHYEVQVISTSGRAI